MTDRLIRKGDLVRIKVRNLTVEGRATSVQATKASKDAPVVYGIELTTVHGAYAYWKQWADGGTVVVLEEAKVP